MAGPFRIVIPNPKTTQNAGDVITGAHLALESVESEEQRAYLTGLRDALHWMMGVEQKISGRNLAVIVELGEHGAAARARARENG